MIIVRLLGVLSGLIGVFYLAIVGAWGMRKYDALEKTPSHQVRVWFYHQTFAVPNRFAPEFVLGLQRRDAGAEQRAKALAAADVKAVQAVETTVRVEQGRIRWRTRTLIREIHDEAAASPAVDRAFPLSNWFVRAHDAAAVGLDLPSAPGPAAGADAAPSVVPPSDLAELIAANYGDCRQDAEELAGWQDFYAKLRADRAAAASPKAKP